MKEAEEGAAGQRGWGRKRRGAERMENRKEAKKRGRGLKDGIRSKERGLGERRGSKGQSVREDI